MSGTSIIAQISMSLTRLAPESWKSARGQNVLQTSALGGGGCKEVNMKLYSIGTSILEV